MILVPLLADFTTLKGFLNLSHLDFDIVSDFELRISSLWSSSIKNPTLAHFRHFSHFRHSFNYNIFPDTQIMQNKPNFGISKMNVNAYVTMRYANLNAGSGQKTKPIQSQFKPNLTQYKANSNPIKANTNPIKANLSKGQK
ncbi:MAG: hypothetical protein ISS76_15845 [Phycisphaerae bacterium]|nr:hypothetical protein [Phycisphaerae bacterium]